MKRAIRESADKTIAVKKQAKRKPWIKPETFEMIEKKRQCKRDSEEYNDLKTTVRTKFCVNRKMLRYTKKIFTMAAVRHIEFVVT